MNTKKMLAAALALAMTLSLAACGGTASTGTGAGTGSESGASGPEVTLIAAHVNNEESSFQYGLEKFKEKLEEVSGGKMTIDIHANGELGGDETELIEKVASQTVDVIVVSPGDLSSAVPQVDFLALPFIFGSLEQWEECIASDEVGGYFANFVDNNGAFHVLTYYMCGIRSLFCTHPVESLADMQGLTIRVKESENVFALWAAYGCKPTALAYDEIYSAMQNNVIDTAENDIANILNMRFHEPAPYITLTQHDYATRFLVIGADKYNSLTDEQKAWVDEAAEYSESLQWEYDIEYADTCREQLEEEGAQFITVDGSEFAAVATPILDTIADKLGVTEGYDAIKAKA